MEATFAIDELLERVHSALPPAALMCVKRTCSRWRRVATTVLESRLAAAEVAINRLRDPTDATKAHHWVQMLGKFQQLFTDVYGANNRMHMEETSELNSLLSSLSHVRATRLLASYTNGGRPCHVRGARNAREPQVVSCIDSLANTLKAQSFHVVIVPKDSIPRWVDAFKQLAPHLIVVISDQTSTPVQRRRSIRDCTSVLLTTYPIALKDLAELKRKLPQTVWYDEGAAHLRINPSTNSTDSLFKLVEDHVAAGISQRLFAYLLGSAAPAKLDVYRHYRWALEFYFPLSAYRDTQPNWRGPSGSKAVVACEREAVKLATKTLGATLPEAAQSGWLDPIDGLEEFVEMALAWKYRSLLVTCGFLDLEGQPETTPSAGGPSSAGSANASWASS